MIVNSESNTRKSRFQEVSTNIRNLFEILIISITAIGTCYIIGSSIALGKSGAEILFNIVLIGLFGVVAINAFRGVTGLVEDILDSAEHNSDDKNNETFESASLETDDFRIETRSGAMLDASNDVQSLTTLSEIFGEDRSDHRFCRTWTLCAHDLHKTSRE